MKNYLDRYECILPYALYLVVGIPLILFRMPWIDEAWFAGPAITFIRAGKFLDFGHCRSDMANFHAYTFELYALAQAGWYYLGEVNIVWGRALNLLFGVLFLWTVDSCLKFVGVNKRLRTLAIAIGGLNYFFLYASTQIRPEIAALLASTLGMKLYLSWRSKPQAYFLLGSSHVLLIISALFHLQGAFVGLSLWFLTLFYDKKQLKSRQLLAFVLPYFSFVTLLFVHVYADKSSSLVSFIDRVFFQENMLGHAGGMFYALFNFCSRDEWLKLVVTIILITLPVVGMYRFWKMRKTNNRIVMLAFACGGYSSWLFTTTHIDDYHAAWLTMPIILSVVSAFESYADAANRKVKIIFINFTLMICFLSIITFVYTAKISYERPLHTVYIKDLSEYTDQYGLNNKTVGGARDIQWYFLFSDKMFCDKTDDDEPEFYILQNEMKLSDPIAHNYTYVKKGHGFTLYRKQ